jgi:hypothetical protein
MMDPGLFLGLTNPMRVRSVTSLAIMAGTIRGTFSGMMGLWIARTTRIKGI